MVRLKAIKFQDGFLCYLSFYIYCKAFKLAPAGVSLLTFDLCLIGMMMMIETFGLIV